MSGHVSNLLLLAVQYMMLDCAELTFTCMYKPYGIEMCRSLCKDSLDTVCFGQEDLSCYCVSDGSKVSSQYSSTEDKRIEHLTGCTFPKGLNVCDRGTNPHKTQSWLTSETKHARGTKIVKHTCSLKLKQACKQGNLDVVKNIISIGKEDINCRDQSGFTPVMFAVSDNRGKVFEYLISQGCDLSVVNFYKKNVLHLACVNGNTDFVKKLVESGKCDINIGDVNGRTPILLTVLYGHRDAFKVLLGRGCNLSKAHNKKNNILHVACIGGNTDIVQLLLSQKIVSIDSRGFRGRTPVMVATKFGHKEVVELLVRNGCNLKLVDKQKSNVLHVACAFDCVHIAQYILSLNIVSINSRGFRGRTPVMVATKFGHKKVVELLVRNGCNLKLVDNKKSNVLHVACILSKVRMVKYLMTLKVAMELKKMKNKRGYTPEQVAERLGSKAVVRLLNSLPAKSNYA